MAEGGPWESETHLISLVVGSEVGSESNEPRQRNKGQAEDRPRPLTEGSEAHRGRVARTAAGPSGKKRSRD